MKIIKVKKWYIAKSDYREFHKRIGYMIMCKNKHEFLPDKMVIKSSTKFTLFGQLLTFLLFNIFLPLLITAYVYTLIFDKSVNFDDIKSRLKYDMQEYMDVLKNEYYYSNIYDSSWRYYHVVLEENDLVEYLI